MTEIHIPTMAPEVLFHLGPVNITNTMINAWIAVFVFFILGIMVYRSVKLKPGKLQNACELVLEMLLPYFDQVTGDRKKTIRFLPIAGTIFFFILLSNWLGLLPGTGSVTVGHNFLLRPANTDLNLTVAMALVSVISSHIFGFITIGFFSHSGKFLQFKALLTAFGKFKEGIGAGILAIFIALIEFMVGIIEIVSEASKVLSLSLRLFGNIFAGEVLITVISALVVAVVPTPFMLLELLVGLIQAAVFAMLTLVYLTVASEKPHGEEAH